MWFLSGFDDLRTNPKMPLRTFKKNSNFKSTAQTTLVCAVDSTQLKRFCIACRLRDWMSNSSGVRRKFPGGEANFCNNRVTSQINFRGSAESTTILGGPAACPRENFAKLHLKIRIFAHSGSKFYYNAFTRLISRWDRKLNFLLSEANEINLYACLDVISFRHVSLIKDAYWSLWAQISRQPKLFTGVHCNLC